MRHHHKCSTKTYLVVKVVDSVSKVSNIVSKVLAVFLALGCLHRLSRGSSAELLYLYSGNQAQCDTVILPVSK